MSDTDLTPVIEAARTSMLAEGRITAINLADYGEAVLAKVPGGVQFADDLQSAIERRLANPRRRVGDCHATEVESFIQIVNRWKVPESSAIWADGKSTRLFAVLNDHPSGSSGAGWRDFIVIYNPPHSPEWIRWSTAAGRDLSQEDFAQFLDDNLADVTTVVNAEKGKYPSPVELLEMARNLTIHTRGQFERRVDPATGTGSLVVKDEHENYSTKIWRAFPLALRVFDAGKVYAVEARIRFRIVGARAVFSFTLHRDEEIKRDAFKEIRELVAAKCEGCPVFAGTP